MSAALMKGVPAPADKPARDVMYASRGWQRGLRRIYLIAWVIVAWNGAVITGRASREPLEFMFVVARFLVAHAGHVSLADLQRHSGRAGNDFAIYRKLYGPAALEELRASFRLTAEGDANVHPSHLACSRSRGHDATAAGRSLHIVQRRGGRALPTTNRGSRAGPENQGGFGDISRWSGCAGWEYVAAINSAPTKVPRSSWARVKRI